MLEYLIKIFSLLELAFQGITNYVYSLSVFLLNLPVLLSSYELAVLQMPSLFAVTGLTLIFVYVVFLILGR